MLFDLQADPDEFLDLGTDPAYRPVLDAYALKLAQWVFARRRYTTSSDRFVETWLQDPRYGGMKIGVW
jgi:hypothetical protein